MVRAVEQIKRELSALERATEQIAKELKDLYHQYLTELGQAAKRQLVLASYHLCTQAYPERFLQLSLRQQQALQQGLQQMGKKAQAELLQQIERLDEPSTADGEQLITLQDLPPQLLAEIAAAVKGKSAQAQLAEPDEAEADPTAELPVETLSDAERLSPSDSLAAQSEDPSAAQISSEAEAQAALEPLTEMAKLLSQSTQPEIPEVLSPPELVKRHLRLEQRIRHTLRLLSQDANQALKQVKILPDLPESILAAAAEAEAMTEMASGTPNVLNVLVELGSAETEADEEDEEGEGAEADNENLPEGSAMTHLVAINLRLSEVEFTDSTVAVWRTKIREKLARLKGLAQQYQQKQREQAIAEAEAAWRASWVES
ncbi:hypothetical protein [Almyronema epifaneia]|uniref:Uncharacterized protein n=1 Tax=Almyronema epifaneia S1 TaxID=2991925 RepID=A0ABW6IG73_9CYAN